MNFSDWSSRPVSANEIMSIINEGEMPPFQFTIIHKNAILDAVQKKALMDGIANNLK